MSILKELLALSEAPKEDPLGFDEPLADEKPKDDKKPAKKKTEKPEPTPEPEEPKDPETFEELFDANQGEVKVYVRLDLYDAKLLDKDAIITANGKKTKVSSGNYVVRNHDDIKKFIIVSEDEFDDLYEPVRQSAKPDAEGFILVKPIGEFEAFQYSGELITIKDKSNESIDIKPNEYVVREKSNKESGWNVKQSEFKKAYKVKM